MILLLTSVLAIFFHVLYIAFLLSSFVFKSEQKHKTVELGADQLDARVNWNFVDVPSCFSFHFF